MEHYGVEEAKEHVNSIGGVELQEHHIGKKVIYVPMHADGPDHPDAEAGIISSWNDKYVFVNYDGNPNTTNKATSPEDLIWG